MTSEEHVNEQFPRDISTHEMKVEIDNGVHRSILFTKSDDSYNLHFRLITWPGNLCICGDMGCYTFSRVDDMFRFFRGRTKPDQGYIAQKCVGICKTVGIDEFSRYNFDEFTKESIDELLHSNTSPDAAILEGLQELLQDQDIASSDVALCRYYQVDPSGFDTSLDEFEQFTYHYLWSVKAAIWGIQQYDERSR